MKNFKDHSFGVFNPNQRQFYEDELRYREKLEQLHAGGFFSLLIFIQTVENNNSDGVYCEEKKSKFTKSSYSTLQIIPVQRICTSGQKKLNWMSIFWINTIHFTIQQKVYWCSFKSWALCRFSARPKVKIVSKSWKSIAIFNINAMSF